MKKLILSIFMLTVCAFSNAGQVPFSEFTLTMFNHHEFAVRFDNRLYPEVTTSFTIQQVPPGKHRLEVIRYHRHGPYNHHFHEVIASRWINIPANSIVSARVNNHFRIEIQDITPYVYACNPYFPAPPPAVSCHPMSSAEFNRLKKTIASVSFESTRLSVMKQAIHSNYVLAGQVRQLMELCWFESTRLELAKYAYPKTLDKENYWKVNIAFQFEGSISELNRFISGC